MRRNAAGLALLLAIALAPVYGQPEQMGAPNAAASDAAATGDLVDDPDAEEGSCSAEDFAKGLCGDQGSLEAPDPQEADDRGPPEPSMPELDAQALDFDGGPSLSAEAELKIADIRKQPGLSEAQKAAMIQEVEEEDMEEMLERMGAEGEYDEMLPPMPGDDGAGMRGAPVEGDVLLHDGAAADYGKESPEEGAKGLYPEGDVPEEEVANPDIKEGSTSGEEDSPLSDVPADLGDAPGAPDIAAAAFESEASAAARAAAMERAETEAAITEDALAEEAVASSASTDLATDAAATGAVTADVVAAEAAAAEAAAAEAAAAEAAAAEAAPAEAAPAEAALAEAVVHEAAAAPLRAPPKDAGRSGSPLSRGQRAGMPPQGGPSAGGPGQLGDIPDALQEVEKPVGENQVPKPPPSKEGSTASGILNLPSETDPGGAVSRPGGMAPPANHGTTAAPAAGQAGTAPADHGAASTPLQGKAAMQHSGLPPAEGSGRPAQPADTQQDSTVPAGTAGIVTASAALSGAANDGDPTTSQQEPPQKPVEKPPFSGRPKPAASDFGKRQPQGARQKFTPPQNVVTKPDTSGCVDLPGKKSGKQWYDGKNGCAQYGANSGWCKQYGGRDFNGEGSAVERCCACGGGNKSPPTPTPTPAPTPTSVPQPQTPPTQEDLGKNDAQQTVTQQTHQRQPPDTATSTTPQLPPQRRQPPRRDLPGTSVPPVPPHIQPNLAAAAERGLPEYDARISKLEEKVSSYLLPGQSAKGALSQEQEARIRKLEAQVASQPDIGREHQERVSQLEARLSAQLQALEARQADGLTTPTGKPRKVADGLSGPDGDRKAAVVAVYSVFRVLFEWTSSLLTDAAAFTSKLTGLDPPANVVVMIFAMFLVSIIFFRTVPARAPAPVAPPLAPPPAPAPAVTAKVDLAPLQRQVEDLQKLQQFVAQELRQSVEEGARGLAKLSADFCTFRQERSCVDEEMLLSTKEILEWFGAGAPQPDAPVIGGGGGGAAPPSLQALAQALVPSAVTEAGDKELDKPSSLPATNLLDNLQPARAPEAVPSQVPPSPAPAAAPAEAAPALQPPAPTTGTVEPAAAPGPAVQPLGHPAAVPLSSAMPPTPVPPGGLVGVGGLPAQPGAGVAPPALQAQQEPPPANEVDSSPPAPPAAPGGPPAVPAIAEPVAAPAPASAPALVPATPPGGPPAQTAQGPSGMAGGRPEQKPIQASTSAFGARPQQKPIQASTSAFGARPQQQPIQAAANPFGRSQPQEIAASQNPFGSR